MSNLKIYGTPSEIYEMTILVNEGVSVSHQQLYELVKPQGSNATVVSGFNPSDSIHAFNSPQVHQLAELDNNMCPITGEIPQKVELPKYFPSSGVTGGVLLLSSYPISKSSLGLPVGTGKAATTTNIYSYIGHKYVKKELPIRVPTPIYKKGAGVRMGASKKLMRVVGRWVPYVGWALLAYEVYSYDKHLRETTGEGIGSKVLDVFFPRAW